MCRTEQGARDEKSGEDAFSVCRDSSADASRRLAFATKKPATYRSPCNGLHSYDFSFSTNALKRRNIRSQLVQKMVQKTARKPDRLRDARDRISRYYFPFLDYERIQSRRSLHFGSRNCNFQGCISGGARERERERERERLVS